MFEYLYSNYDMPGFFRLFGFVSFRALLAGLFSMTLSFVVGDRIIRWLTGLKFRETIRDDGPSSHASKAGTPTMGGILILLSLSASCILFGNFSNLHFNLILYCTLLLGGIGFWDDYSKVVLKKKGGMSAKTKMALSILVAAFFLFMYIRFTPAEVARADGINYGTTDLFVPFIKGPVWTMPLILGVVFWLCVILGTVHGVNLTDGLDGLAIGNVSIVTVTFGVLAYLTGSPRMADYLNIPTVTGAVEISVFLAALAGAGIGFLWFNAAPARIFMGDTGSLSLGGALGMMMASNPKTRRLIDRLVINDIGPEVPQEAIERIREYASEPQYFSSLNEARAYFERIYMPFGYLSDEEWDLLVTHSVRRLDTGMLTQHYDPQILKQFGGAQNSTLAWAMFSSITCKMLLIRGMDSDVLPASIADRMVNSALSVERLDISNTGHAPFLNTSEQISKIRSFLTA